MAKELSCGVEFLRGILLFLNALFVLVGLALIGIGVYIKVDNDFASILAKLAEISSFKEQSLGFLAFAMIGGGVFTLLIALFGAMGALWHKPCFLYMYAVVLALLMLVELVGFIMAFVYKGELQTVYEKPLSDVLHDALKRNDTNIISIFHDLEAAMKCCGVLGVKDYANYSSAETDWCKTNPDSRGCSTAIMDFLNKNLPIIGGTLGGVLLLELFGLIAAIALAVAIRHAPDEDYSSSPGRVLSKIIPRRR